METERKTPWLISFSGKAGKQAKKLPPDMRDRLYALKIDLELTGPEQSGWRNYGPIVGAKDVYHCHLNSGQPRYVVVWKVIQRTIQLIEIQYAGPHGGVNYRRFK
jgi:hypothetical protein